MAQLLDFYTISPNGITAKFENGDARVLSNREIFSILQNEKTPGSVPSVTMASDVSDQGEDGTKTYVTRITAIRKRTTTVYPANRMVA